MTTDTLIDPNAIKEQFGERIRSLRAQKGWSLSYLAGQAGISKPYLSQLEDGKGNPSFIYITRIAAALGISYQDLMGQEKVNEVATETVEVTPEDARINVGDDGLGFWALLCKRAATVQRVYQYDGNLSFDNEFQRVLGEYDWVVKKYETRSDCAKLVQEAIRTEDSVWKNKKNPDTKDLDAIIEIWEDAASEVDDIKRQYAFLAVYWSLGNAFYAPNSYKYRRALDVFKKALPLVSTVGLEAEDEAGFFTTLGWVSYYAGEYNEAIIYFNKSSEKWEYVTKQRAKNNGLAGTYRGLASAYQRILQIKPAKDAFDKMLFYANEVSVKEGSKLQLLWGEFRIGSFYKFIGDLREADKHLITADKLWVEYAQSEEMDRGLNSIRTMILNNRADLLIRQGINHDQAQKYLEESIGIGEEIPDKRSQAYSYWFLSLLHINSEEWDKAMLYLERSIKLFQEMTIPRYGYTILLSKSRVYCALKAPLTAKWLLTDANEEQIEDESLKLLIRITRAFISWKNHELEAAQKLYEENIPLLGDLKYEEAGARLDYAEMLLEKGEIDKVQEQVEKAHQLCEHYGYASLLKKVKKNFKHSK